MLTTAFPVPTERRGEARRHAGDGQGGSPFVLHQTARFGFRSQDRQSVGAPPGGARYSRKGNAQAGGEFSFLTRRSSEPHCPLLWFGTPSHARWVQQLFSRNRLGMSDGRAHGFRHSGPHQCRS
jgi:hypothetical protein